MDMAFVIVAIIIMLFCYLLGLIASLFLSWFFTLLGYRRRRKS
jgi:hypothetical protein